MTPERRLSLLVLSAASTLVLAGCASGTAAGEQVEATTISVVASTNVYGQIAEEIGGEFVEVTSIVSNESQDPHSFEPSARDQLAVSKADLIIENGGGYDGFIDAMIESSGSEAPVVTAVEYSHSYPENEGHDAEAGADDHADEHAEAETDEHAEADDHAHDHESDEHGHEHIEGFNEHVWYDPHTVAYVAEAIAAELAELSPDAADEFSANAEAFVAEIENIEAGLAEIAAAHSGVGVFVTEPVPAYLLAEAGLENVTPEAFSEAVEEGQDVPPATLLEAIGLIESGDVSLVITNTQTAGAETAQIVGEADGRGIPTLAFSETVPEGQTYISWMQANVEALKDALDA